MRMNPLGNMNACHNQTYLLPAQVCQLTSVTFSPTEFQQDDNRQSQTVFPLSLPYDLNALSMQTKVTKQHAAHKGSKGATHSWKPNKQMVLRQKVPGQSQRFCFVLLGKHFNHN